MFDVCSSPSPALLYVSTSYSLFFWRLLLQRYSPSSGLACKRQRFSDTHFLKQFCAYRKHLNPFMHPATLVRSVFFFFFNGSSSAKWPSFSDGPSNYLSLLTECPPVLISVISFKQTLKLELESSYGGKTSFSLNTMM